MNTPHGASSTISGLKYPWYNKHESATKYYAGELIARDSSLDGTAEQVHRMKAEVRTTLRSDLLAAVKSFKDGAGAELELQLTLASEKAASSWLTCRPLAIHGFCLSNVEFRDALCLRYGRTPARLPSGCVCGHGNFDVTHALSCSTGGFPSIRHNEIRDLTADVLRTGHARSVHRTDAATSHWREIPASINNR